MAQERHVILGAGPIGAGVAQLLAGQGHQVRVVTRSGSGPQHPLVERVAADAADGERITHLAQDAVAIYNCANPAYHRWASDWPPMATALLTAAERAGAVLAIASNLYGYGPAPMPMTEDTPLAATFTKGRVRAEMWQQALAAHRAGRVRATEVRASDYLGAGAQGALHRSLPGLLAGKTVRVLGDPDAPHTWTFTGDVARLLVTVARDQRAWGRAWHVPSNPAVPVGQVVADLCRLAGVRQVPVRRIPPAMIRIGGLFSPLLRELPEVAYQHDRPFVMDSSAARATFGLEPTAWLDVLGATLPAAANAGTVSA